jgi:hypothetical protein
MLSAVNRTPDGAKISNDTETFGGSSGGSLMFSQEAVLNEFQPLWSLEGVSITDLPEVEELELSCCAFRPTKNAVSTTPNPLF